MQKNQAQLEIPPHSKFMVDEEGFTSTTSQRKPTTSRESPQLHTLQDVEMQAQELNAPTPPQHTGNNLQSTPNPLPGPTTLTNLSTNHPNHHLVGHRPPAPQAHDSPANMEKSNPLEQPSSPSSPNRGCTNISGGHDTQRDTAPA